MGGIYQVQGDISRAKEYYEKALNISLSVNGENDLGVAVCYSNIGGIYQDQGDYVNALTYYKKALEIQLSYGEISPDVSTTYNNIGNLYSDQRNKSKALEYYEKSLKIDLSLYREDHPQVATQYYNIGQVYYSQKNYDKALEYNEKALEGLLVNGVNLPLAASAYYNIGVIYYNRKYYAKSLLFLEKSLAIDRKILDERLQLSEDYIQHSKDFGWENGDNEIKARKRVLDWIQSDYYKSLIKDDKEYYKILEEHRLNYLESQKEEFDKANNFGSSVLDSRKTLLQSYFDATNSIVEAQHEINKELEASKTMYEWLDEDTRRLLFNQEDYNTLSEELYDIQYKADKLKRQYERDLNNSTLETVESITSNYQMQYETLMKSY